MFFIGIFGIEEKAKVIGQKDVEMCPFCARKGYHTFFKVYNYFHFFFIPLFKWNTRYFIQTSCCSKLYLITNPQLTYDLERGRDVTFTLADVELYKNLPQMYDEGIDFDFCPNCGNRVSKTFLYCPYCGQKLE